MKNKGLWQIMGFAVTSFLGTIFHFLYDWSGNSAWASLFSAVNESTWEHMKLLFFPMLLFAIVQGFFFKDFEGFWCVKAKGILLGIILIPVIFYTYNGAFGKSPDWLNISIFFISALIVYYYEWRQLKKESDCKHKRLSVLILVILAALFILFTFFAPSVNLFKDPITQTYGI